MQQVAAGGDRLDDSGGASLPDAARAARPADEPRPSLAASTATRHRRPTRLRSARSAPRTHAIDLHHADALTGHAGVTTFCTLVTCGD